MELLDFYVTAVNGDKHRFLLGPWKTKRAAVANVARGRKLVTDASDVAWFYWYGAASVPRGTAIATVFGS